MSRTRYYILHRGIRKGPYSSDRLYGKIHDGAIGNNTLCCEHKLLDQDPDAPWFPLSKILGYISPETEKPQRRRRKRAVPATGVAPSSDTNVGAILVTLAGIAMTLFFVLFFTAPTFTAAELGVETPGQAREILIYRCTRIAGIFAGIFITVAGILCTSGSPPKES